MSLLTQRILWDAAKILAVLISLIYVGMVLTAYSTEGTHFQPRFRWSAPTRSSERLLVWSGIKILDWLLRAARSIFDQLFAASAEVGMWLADRSGSKVQHKIRSKFL